MLGCAVAEKTETVIELLTGWEYSIGLEVVRFMVDGDEYRYLIDRAFIAEASDRQKNTPKTFLNYIKTCPGRCRKNGVEIDHLGSLSRNEGEGVEDE